MSSIVVDPTGSSREEQAALAARSRSLDGMTIGLLHSTKHNSDRVLDAIAASLEERFGIREVVRQIKPTFARPVPAEMAREMAERCDVVITGIGD